MAVRWNDGYSADVEIRIVVNGKAYDVAKLGSESFVLRDEVKLEQDTQCTLIVKIDDYQRILHITLPGGAIGPDHIVPYKTKGALDEVPL